MVRISEDERSQSMRLARWRRDHDAISVVAATTGAVTAEAVATAEEAGNYRFFNQTTPSSLGGRGCFAFSCMTLARPAGRASVISQFSNFQSGMVISTSVQRK